MLPVKPQRNALDFLVASLSPLLIIALVESICFFLILVFYRGGAIGSVRWVMFWFVMAVVLVSRIGIEQGSGVAAVYGLALAAATWLYLLEIHPAFILGAIMLGTLWWCANKLTVNCTLIDDVEETSDRGLLQTAWSKLTSRSSTPVAVAKGKSTPTEATATAKKPKRRPAAPGVWLIYFSLAAIPLFGLGGTLLPTGNITARHASFVYLFVYLGSSLGLLITTSFLGLRHYLRQRFLPMPVNIITGWLKFGAALALVVMLLALLLPRPGVTQAWQTLGYHIDYRVRQASYYAMRFGPHGTGPGRPGDSGQQPDAPPGSGSSGSGVLAGAAPGTGSGGSAPGQGSPGDSGPASSGANANNPASPLAPLSGTEAHIQQLLKILVWVAALIAIASWAYRQREMLLQLARSFWTALTQFFHNLFSLGNYTKRTAEALPATPALAAFSTYKNPFLTASDRVWPPEQLILYSYEALQSWAVQQGLKPAPEKTAREFCLALGEKYPALAPALEKLGYLHGHAAYDTAAPAGCEVEFLRSLWQYISSPHRD